MENLSLIVFVLCSSALVLVGVCYGVVWVRLYFEKRDRFYQNYVNRKIDKLHK